VDLSVQQALNAFTIARIADVVGDTGTRDLFEAEYGQLSELINELLWDDTEGFYHNLTEDGSFLRCKTPAGFWPMVASLADDYRSGRLVAHVINPSEFWRSHVIPSLSADHPQYSPLGFYWRGSVWAPWLYHTIKGLEARGFGSLAHEASINHVENLVKVFKWTGTIWENYSPDWPIPGIPAKPDFVGWSGLGPIALLIENILGIRVRAPSDSILWDIRLTERHGITNLRFCNNTVSLTCERRETALSPAEITAVTDNPFSLTVNIGHSSFTQPIPPGTTVIYTDL
jgi:glycogen debranching enzyme